MKYRTNRGIKFIDFQNHFFQRTFFDDEISEEKNLLSLTFRIFVHDKDHKDQSSFGRKKRLADIACAFHPGKFQAKVFIR